MHANDNARASFGASIPTPISAKTSDKPSFLVLHDTHCHELDEAMVLALQGGAA